MTGRKGRVVSDGTGAISYELRSAQDVPLEILNLTEKQRFMDGEKLVAVISEAASSGKLFATNYLFTNPQLTKCPSRILCKNKY